MSDHERDMEEFRNRRALVLKARINREWYPEDNPEYVKFPKLGTSEKDFFPDKKPEPWQPAKREYSPVAEKSKGVEL